MCVFRLCSTALFAFVLSDLLCSTTSSVCELDERTLKAQGAARCYAALPGVSREPPFLLLNSNDVEAWLAAKSEVSRKTLEEEFELESWMEEARRV